MVFAFAFTLSACGDTETEETAEPEKVTATATMNAGEVPVEVTIDTSQGYSVVQEIAKDLCVFFHQESVLITKAPSEIVVIRETLT